MKCLPVHPPPSQKNKNKKHDINIHISSYGFTIQISKLGNLLLVGLQTFNICNRSSWMPSTRLNVGWMRPFLGITFLGGGSTPNTSETKKHVGGFPKMVGFPNKPMSVSYSKKIMTWGVKWKFSHHFKETPRATQKKIELQEGLWWENLYLIHRFLLTNFNGLFLLNQDFHVYLEIWKYKYTVYIYIYTNINTHVCIYIYIHTYYIIQETATMVPWTKSMQDPWNPEFQWIFWKRPKHLVAQTVVCRCSLYVGWNHGYFSL